MPVIRMPCAIRGVEPIRWLSSTVAERRFVAEIPIRCQGGPASRSRRHASSLATLLVLFVLAASGPCLATSQFVRGDCNGSAGIDIADATALLEHLFAGDTVPCADGCDFDDSGRLEITDVLGIIAYLFSGAAQPQPPFPLPGSDPTPDALGCEGSRLQWNSATYAGFLDEAVVAGDVAIWLEPDGLVESVAFFLDDPLLAGPPATFDPSEPFELVDITPSTPFPFDTATLLDGPHTLHARIVRSSGETSVVVADFTVDNTPGPAVYELRESVSRFGITWNFDQPMPVGHFAGGDWWVVGPVVLVDISPPSVEVGGRVLHGSVIDPDPAAVAQGYDSATYGAYAFPGSYDPALNVALGVSVAAPLAIEPGHSLVSSISRPEAGVRPQLLTAAVLTVLPEPPPAGSFRPPYAGGDHLVHHQVDELDLGLLLQLTPAAGAPDAGTVTGWFERAWLDHVPGFLGREIHPLQNMPDYGRDMASEIGIAALVVHLDLPEDEKLPLVVHLVQLGLDLYAIGDADGAQHWTPNGGHASGRKWPILFAGSLLGDTELSSVGDRDDILFGEDAQTFVVEETSPGIYNEGYGGYDASHVGMAEWGIRHQTDITMDDVAITAPYRLCCTANSWIGFVLAVRMMGAVDAWNHDALFDYQDRFMDLQPPGSWTRAWDPWSEAMWDLYRADF